MGDQTEMKLGPVGVVRGGLACKGCGLDLPCGQLCCPACGLVCRIGMAGRPYPDGRMERYRWAFDQDVLMRDADGRTKTDTTAKFVLCTLVHFDGPNRAVFPSVETMARMTGLSARSVKRAIHRLESVGWIVRQKRRYRGKQSTNKYRIRQAEAAFQGDTESLCQGDTESLCQGDTESLCQGDTESLCQGDTESPITKRG